MTALENGDETARRSLTLIGRLFLIDRYAKSRGLQVGAWREIRNRVSLRIIEKLFEHWSNIGLKVLPKSSLGMALAYVNKRRDGFRNFLKSPRLCLDNNLSERHLRKVVVGRKNYMFCGSEEGARRAAVIYSIVGTCELLGIDVYKYFAEAMRMISVNRSVDARLLLPHRFMHLAIAKAEQSKR